MRKQTQFHRALVPTQEILGADEMAFELPRATPELIEFLKATFPSRCKLRNESVEAHDRYAGKVELVEMLEELLAEQDERDREAQRDTDR